MRQNRHRMGSGSSWYVFPARSRALSTNVYYLGLRHNCMAGTDYDYLIRVSREEAEWLVSSSRGRRYEERVHEFCDCLKEK